MATLTHPTRPPIFTYSDNSCIRSHKKCAFFQRGENSTPLSVRWRDESAHKRLFFTPCRAADLHFSILSHPWWLGIDTMTRLLKKIEWNARNRMRWRREFESFSCFIESDACAFVGSVHAILLLLHLRMLEWKSNSHESRRKVEMKNVLWKFSDKFAVLWGTDGREKWSWRKLEVNFVVFSSASHHFTWHSAQRRKMLLVAEALQGPQMRCEREHIDKEEDKKKKLHIIYDYRTGSFLFILSAQE